MPSASRSQVKPPYQKVPKGSKKPSPLMSVKMSKASSLPGEPPGNESSRVKVVGGVGATVPRGAASSM